MKEQERMDLIDRQKALDAVSCIGDENSITTIGHFMRILRALPSEGSKIIRCKDCKFYSPMNRETKTGICNLTMHQNFGDNWFCAGAERRTDCNGRD